MHFYDYEIEQTENGPNLFENQPDWEDAPKRHYNSVEECFASFFQSRHMLELPRLKVTGSGKNQKSEWEKYRCDVLRHEDGVILMTLENNKSKHTIIEKKDVEHEHHPYCYVIVDTRYKLIGIEKNSAFDGKPDKVAEIIQDGMSMLMMSYHKHVVLHALMKKSTEFWPIIEELQTKFKDTVRQIRIDCNGEESDTKKSDLMAIMPSLCRRTTGEAVFMLNAPDNGELKMNEVYDDVTHIAELCLLQKNYDLTVRFKNFGVYRYGADMVAQFGTDMEVLDAFDRGDRVMDFDHGTNNYDLLMWMDKINELLKGYAKATAIRSGRKSRNRR